jgi:hypothetical protein
MCRHLQAEQGPQERCSGTLEVHVVRMDITQPLFGPVTRRFGA